MNLIKLILKYRYFFAGFVILAWVIFVNRFPQEYVVIGGDTAQLVDASSSFFNNFFFWQGRTVLFYGIFYLLSKAGIGNTLQLSFYLGIFIIGSYLSFYLFTLLVLPKFSKLSRCLGSLFYALNLYTLYIFTYAWGYSHYQVAYIFIPVITGLYVSFIRQGRKQDIFWFTLAMVPASAGFGNPAFGVAFLIFLLMLTGSLLIVGNVVWKRELLIRIGILLLVSLGINFYWILALAPQMNAGVSNIYAGETLNLDWWIRYTANDIIDTVRLSQTNTMYFPDNFPYAYLASFKKIFLMLTFIPIFFIMGSFLRLRGYELYNRKIFIAFSVLLIAFILLVARVKFPFEAVNDILYHLWGLNTLRSYEKTAIFTPFIMGVLFFVGYEELRRTKKILATFIVVLVLITPLPFYIGKLQQNMSAKFAGDPMSKKNYLKSELSFLVKIPNEYYKIRPLLNEDKEIFHYAALPYTMTRAFGWAEYPKWKMVGVDITQYLYNKKFISPDKYYFGKWLYAQAFNGIDPQRNSTDPVWIVKLLGLMNSKYIIYHKDAYNNINNKLKSNIRLLESRGDIIPVEINKFFVLYKINDNYYLPAISWQKGNIDINPNPQSIDENFFKIKDASKTATFKEINPSRYTVKPTANLADYQLVFSEPFNLNWKAYAVLSDGEKVEIKNHFVARHYANGWKLDAKLAPQLIVIEYYPMRLAWYGMAISGIFLSGIIIYFGYNIHARRKDNKK